MNDPQKNHLAELREAGEELLHSLSTPLAILRMDQELLNHYLPALLAGRSGELPARHREALEQLPERLGEQAQRLEEAMDAFWQTCGESETKRREPVSAVGGGPLRILLVEDEPVHRDIATKLLAPRHRLELAASGAKALTLCRDTHYDLILMDLRLPDTDGRQLARELREAGQDGTLVAVTNLPGGLPADAREFFDGQLDKPLRGAALKRFLAGRRDSPVTEN